jgi:hypothetical protein
MLKQFSQSLYPTGRSVSQVNYTSRYTTLTNTKKYICLSVEDIEASVRAFIRQHGMTTDMLFGEFDGEVLKLSVLTCHKDKRSALFFGMFNSQPIVDTNTMIVTSLPTPQVTGTNTQRISYINYVIDNLC